MSRLDTKMGTSEIFFPFKDVIKYLYHIKRFPAYIADVFPPFSYFLLKAFMLSLAQPFMLILSNTCPAGGERLACNFNSHDKVQFGR